MPGPAGPTGRRRQWLCWEPGPRETLDRLVSSWAWNAGVCRGRAAARPCGSQARTDSAPGGRSFSKGARGLFQEAGLWGGRRVRATSLGGGCLSDFYYSPIFYAFPLPRRFSVNDWAGPFSPGPPGKPGPAGKGASLREAGEHGTSRHTRPQGEPGPKGRRVVCGG